MNELINLPVRPTGAIRSALGDLAAQSCEKYLNAQRRASIGRTITHMLFELDARAGKHPVVPERPEPTPDQLKDFHDAVGYGVFDD